ncbi:hypothetical protein CSH63_01090 [Micromonospora tulbaghiae]|uniref:Uncharacterized protein n=1 Tax=Micromonospora tulbaghiae TaxID=479978 RepID=A0A386WEX3_9ACTN|nr:hypothetical protein [Micromonospora tulbaghiae]AYF26079.1 hypothetical protein CSH63_01090 [Micromonospora tulbaghiae]
MIPWRLVDKVRGTGRSDLAGGRWRDEAVGASGTTAHPGGVLVDGVLWRLDGEPPRAVSKGWGDLSWTRH